MVCTGGKSEIGITTSLREHFHFGIDAAKAAAGRVGQREISVHESVTRLGGAFLQREATMASGQVVAKFSQNAPGILGGVRLHHAVMQMNFNFAPARMAVLGGHLEQSFMVLFRRIKVSMNKRPAIVVASALDGFGIFPAPPFHPAL